MFFANFKQELFFRKLCDTHDKPPVTEFLFTSIVGHKSVVLPKKDFCR